MAIVNLPTPDQEHKRLSALSRYRTIEAGLEPICKRTATLAARIFGAPIAVVSLIEQREQRMISAVGTEPRRIDRSASICARTIASKAVRVLPDLTLEQDSFEDNPLVRGDGVRFYAGAPLVTKDGHPIGTLSVLDTRARTDFGSKKQATLRDLAVMLINNLDLRLAEFHATLREEERRALETSLRHSEARFRSLFDNARDAMLVISAGTGMILDANAQSEQLLGKLRRDLIGLHASELHPPGSSAPPYLELEPPAGETYLGEAELLTQLGECVPVEISAGLIDLPDGACALHASFRDIRQRKRAQQLSHDQHAVLEQIAQNAPIGRVLTTLVSLIEHQLPDALVAVLSLSEGVLEYRAAPRLPRTFTNELNARPVSAAGGNPAAAARQKTCLISADIASDPHWDEDRALALAHGLHACWATPIIGKSGEALGVIALYFKQPRTPDNRVLDLLGSVSYLAALSFEQKRAEAELLYQAHHDALTGLPNRALLHDRLVQALHHAARESLQVSVVLLDLDNFKLVNDTLGHNAGDALLQEIANRLSKRFRGEDTVARLGGDEFVIVLTTPRTHDSERFVQEIQALLEPAVALAGHQVNITPSIGVSRYPDDGDHPEALLQAADGTMYAAKRKRKNLAKPLSGLGTPSAEPSKLEQELRQALHQQQFELYYQPRISLATRRIVGAEALLRWRHPERGLLAPAAFLEVATQANLLGEIDRWVWREVIRQAPEWHRPGLHISMNVSPERLHHASFADQFAALLAESQLKPGALELEITERTLMQDVDLAAKHLRQLKKLAPGLRVAMDDFGNEYSSLNYLNHLPVDTLKVDRSFVSKLFDREKFKKNWTILRSIFYLGHELGINTVAEGVENNEQLSAVIDLRCHEAQGFYFDKPLPYQDFLNRVA